MRIQSINNSLNFKPFMKAHSARKAIKQNAQIDEPQKTKYMLPVYTYPFKSNKIGLSSDESFFQSFLTKKGKVTKKEYDDIIANHPEVIEQANTMVNYGFDGRSGTTEVARAALELKNKYDKQYGKNYTIISIGTSPAAISEVMSALGSNVVFLPASGLNKIPSLRQNDPENFIIQTNLKYMIEYVKSKINNSNGTIILLDYCDTGVGLDSIYEVFKESEICQTDRIQKHSIAKDLGLLDFDALGKKAKRKITNVKFDLDHVSFEIVSNTPHFHLNDNLNNARGCITSKNKKQQEIFDEFESYSRPFARAFVLCSINEAMKFTEKKIV